MKRIGFLSALLLLLVVIGLLCNKPMGASAATVANGDCGDNLSWVLDDAGTLTISGKGTMYDWSYSSHAQWYSNRSSVKSVIIENGVTSIGYGAFWSCTNLTSVTIPDSVTNIGGHYNTNVHQR